MLFHLFCIGGVLDLNGASCRQFKGVGVALACRRYRFSVKSPAPFQPISKRQGWSKTTAHAAAQDDVKKIIKNKLFQSLNARSAVKS